MLLPAGLAAACCFTPVDSAQPSQLAPQAVPAAAQDNARLAPARHVVGGKTRQQRQLHSRLGSPCSGRQQLLLLMLNPTVQLLLLLLLLLSAARVTQCMPLQDRLTPRHACCSCRSVYCSALHSTLLRRGLPVGVLSPTATSAAAAAAQEALGAALLKHQAAAAAAAAALAATAAAVQVHCRSCPALACCCGRLCWHHCHS